MQGAGTLALFAKFIAGTMGLYFSAERLFELEQKMVAMSREAGHADVEQYLLWLMSAPLSREQLENLARALTIGETYFLRDPKSYQVLEEHLIPELVARRRGTDKTLRIWSAGCSSGEEPYTLAILLCRTIPDLETWNVSLIATDINPQALERGRQGIYSQWSFRNAPAWLMDYFTIREEGRFEIIPRLRAMVRFDHLNLADDRALDECGGTDSLDIIFCRNVMLYFGAEQVERTTARFQAALREGGWLFVGPTEVDQRFLKGFTCQRFDGAFVLRKTAGKREDGHSPCRLPSPAPAPKQVPASVLPRPEPTAASPALHPVAVVSEDSPGADPRQGGPQGSVSDCYGEALAMYRAGCYEQAADSVRRALDAGAQPADTLALGARAYANLGRFSEARQFCEQAIAADRLSPQNHYLLSMILEQQGDLAAAATSLQHVLFIDHDFLLAYFALGNLFRQAGDRGESERNFANALRLLERRDPHEVLPEAEGMTAGGLAHMIRGMSKGRSEHEEG